jgi:hypothetical protein
MGMKDFYIEKMDWRFEKLSGLYWPMLHKIGKFTYAGRKCRQEIRNDNIVMTLMTYKRGQYLKRTIESLLDKNPNILSRLRIILLVQGPNDAPTESVIDEFKSIFDKILRPGINLGTGGGFTYLMKHSLDTECSFVLNLEDDWLSNEGFEKYLDEILKFLKKDEDVGFIRLRSIEEKISPINLISKKEIKHDIVTANIRKGNYHFSFNPIIIKTSVIPFLLPAQNEVTCEKKYELLGLQGAQLMAKCFIHVGNKRAEGWKR